METNRSPASKKILVVDDDPDIRDIIIMILEAEGYNGSGLDNGNAVVNTVQQNQPDIVLLDVHLGDRDGRDICKELKEQPATQAIPIIIISASYGWHAFQEKQCYPDEFLAKPFNINELVYHVKRLAA